MIPLLEVQHLGRDFGDVTAVDDVSFDVQPGEAFGLLGPNGAGKSTSMMIVSGILAMHRGDVILNGHSVRDDPSAARRVLGVVPQDLAIYPDLTAWENLCFFGSLYGLSGKPLKDRSQEALDQVGLWKRRDSLSGTFSGGMKRRLNFAAAILHRPAMLILDEPTVGVDPQSRSHLLDCVRRLQESGTAVIYASHYMEEVQSLCARVAVIDHGKVLTCDTVPRLLRDVSRMVDLELPPDAEIPTTSLPGGAEILERDDRRVVRLASHHEDESELNGDIGRLMTELARLRIPLLSIRTEEPSLERLFLQLTGTRLRD